MLFTFYQHVPLAAPLARTDEVLPHFVVNQLPSGLAGFIVAAIVAAALSPSLNAMAATTVNDFYKPRARTRSRRRAAAAAVAPRRPSAGASCSSASRSAPSSWTRSVLDAGLAVLSFASGAVLGAFVIATLMPGVRERRRARRHGRRPDHDDRGVGVHAAGVDVVRLRRRGDDVRHRLDAVGACAGARHDADGSHRGPPGAGRRRRAPGHTWGDRRGRVGRRVRCWSRPPAV